MANAEESKSRTHDLCAAGIGALAVILLISVPWQVDTSGPDPFYKGPLIFPLIVLCMMIASSLPAFYRLAKPPKGATWHLDGGGIPYKTIVVLCMLIAYLWGMVLIGLEVSSVMFLMGALYYLGQRTPLKLFVLPLVVMGVMYVMFVYFLDIYFPTPLVMDWIGVE
ncbi:tripartite tricarboxylate transporter TctB family protein [Dethiosulfatarculus sandiegensis]|uniref:DUF1468 domain-containing protein n=1 Tax=Dethiosulfatarculus sandiegensis TaxID=1429043 RepID=A0A0D2J0K9_9BACT|nr:tripartite tricarboxylate transporter TctB family protein [Dethiosulfatarculus sandiegensis]KIX11784.1 hypothetical protein X474_22995 [Dethiosulfatarculus sandiegensis]